MHRVNPKRRQAVILRIIAYTLTLTLSAITTVLLLYIALGYRFHSGHVVRSGLLLVDNQPEAGAIYVNGQEKDNSTPGRFVLAVGNYDLGLKRSGYRTWEKSVAIAASGVREVDYPWLIPTALKPTQLLEVTTPAWVSQSPDHKLLLSQVANQPTLELTELDPKTPKQTTLALPAAVPKENGQTGLFKVIEWALNNKQVLMTQTLPSGATNLISLNVTKPEATINITTLYGAQVPTDIHYVGSNTNSIYGLKDGVLSTYSLEQAQSAQLLDLIRSYQPYANDTILFDRLDGAQHATVGIWKDKNSVVIQRNAITSSPALLKYARFNNHFYFAIGSTSVSTVTVYRDPLAAPVLSSQLPFVTLPFTQPLDIAFSPSSQFLLVQNGSTLLSYDFDDLLRYSFTLPFAPAPSSQVEWVDGAHLAAQASDGSNMVFEYDGKNLQTLVPSSFNTPLFYASDNRSTYRLFDSNGKAHLEVTSLVAAQN